MRYRLTKSSMKLPKFNNTEYTATVNRYVSNLTEMGTIFAVIGISNSHFAMETEKDYVPKNILVTGGAGFMYSQIEGELID